MSLFNLLGKMRAFSDEGQKQVDYLIDRARNEGREVGLPPQAEDQGFMDVVFQHTGPKGIESYDIGATRQHGVQSPAGLYATTSGRETAQYDKMLRDKGIDPETYDLVTRAGKTFVVGGDKPTGDMQQAFAKIMADNTRSGTYTVDDILGSAATDDHQLNYLRDKMDYFRRTGTFNVDVPPQVQSDIYRAGGADALVWNGNEFVFLKPEQTRQTAAEFNPKKVDRNEWMAGVALPTAGALAALAPDDAMAMESYAEPVEPVGLGQYAGGLLNAIVNIAGPDIKGNIGDGTLYGNEYRR